MGGPPSGGAPSWFAPAVPPWARSCPCSVQDRDGLDLNQLTLVAGPPYAEQVLWRAEANQSEVRPSRPSGSRVQVTGGEPLNSSLHPLQHLSRGPAPACSPRGCASGGCS